MITSLSGRFLLLTCVFVVLAEILVLVPSVARFREDYLLDRLERSQIASLALLADDMISPDIEEELLRNAEVYNVVLRRDEARQLVLSSPVPQPISETFDLREATAPILIHDALRLLMDSENRVIRVIGSPVRDAGQLIEITMPTQPLRTAMLDYALGVLVLSATISLLTALLLFLSVRVFLMRPIKRVVSHVLSYAESPEDSRRVIEPQAGIRELRDVEEALQTLQTQLTAALRQKERLAQLGGAVAKISHDLRNILTSAQLFTDRLEVSEDPAVQRLAPKLVNSITRAVHLCESTLAFGKAEEPAPQLSHIRLADVVGDVIDSERLAVGDADISFAEDIPATLMLRADQEQLYRVISNLVRNARQAIVTSGKPGEIAVAASEDDEAWIIHVTDTGPGLPPKAREFLFTAFQGGVRKGGSGLGLVISAELIRGHGGTLKLDRTGPEGTEFTILLPKGGLDLSERRA
ncbi:sensor histidine kinase [Pseudooceanicola nanhaiensis]|uniref:sensor histidine kinase n=1 Tax=Pseudooceanicola nanhaiensis TaxID=375761 RepID=UPI001CD205E3|nr:HAMP domain-containing sensor histidine kinase [Pseudooceanicola nanhaiensis]MCA0922737.1 HAMP domain-containing histidine kinase [Pseudooceanicola nanhaiensis]